MTEAGIALWDWIRSGGILNATPFEARLMHVMPDEFDDGDFKSAVVEDATASMIYALRACHSDSAQNAVWSARRIYEAADRYASHFISGHEYIESAEIRILNNLVVQLELSRQARDLALLLTNRADEDIIAALLASGECERVLESR